MERLISQARALPVPLKGVFHLAMVIDDAPLAALTAERFRTALDAALATENLSGPDALATLHARLAAGPRASDAKHENRTSPSRYGFHLRNSALHALVQSGGGGGNRTRDSIPPVE